MFKSKKIKQLEKTIQELFVFVKAIMVTLDLSEIEINEHTIEKVRKYDIYVEESYMKFAKKIKLIAPEQVINIEKIHKEYLEKR